MMRRILIESFTYNTWTGDEDGKGKLETMCVMIKCRYISLKIGTTEELICEESGHKRDVKPGPMHQ